MLIQQVSMHGEDGLKDIFISDKKIQAVYSTGLRTITPSPAVSLSCPGTLVFPGLINSHDHLDFNVFPQLGNKLYANYQAWAKDIHQRNSREIESTLQIPLHLRTLWGIYKNLLNGVTTVVNHGKRLQVANNLVTVFQDCYCLHSPGFEKKWKWKLNNPFRTRRHVAMHVGEGTDQLSHDEIDQLTIWNIFRKEIVGIHGVAMDVKQAEAFRALVWCPASNYFLLNKTAPVGTLKKHVPVIFGTDSTLSAGWNLWDQLRLARIEKMVTDEELYNMLTTLPASVWNLEGAGELTPGSRADLVIAKKKDHDAGFLANFFALDPEDLLLVMHKGEVRMVDDSLVSQFEALSSPDFCRIMINNTCKHIQGDLKGLIAGIHRYDPAARFPVKSAELM